MQSHRGSGTYRYGAFGPKTPDSAVTLHHQICKKVRLTLLSCGPIKKAPTGPIHIKEIPHAAKCPRFSSVSALVLAACAASATIPAHADAIAWTDWSAVRAGSPGSATGSIGGLTITYSGQNSGLLTGYPSWTPSSTFTGGVVGNPPPAANNSVQIEGGASYTETITFSSPVADPIFAVWSLGAGGTPASFDFSPGEPFTVQGDGPSSEYGGTSLYISGEDVEGQEGNGIIQFDGSFSSITFTTPQV
jgi:hypothetical protein